MTPISEYPISSAIIRIILGFSDLILHPPNIAAVRSNDPDKIFGCFIFDSILITVFTLAKCKFRTYDMEIQIPADGHVTDYILQAVMLIFLIFESKILY